jgi:hypothetical protein
MRATSSFADEDWGDIEMTVPNLEDFNEPQPSTEAQPSTDEVTLKNYLFCQQSLKYK